MEAREYLKQVRRLEVQLDNRLREIERLDADIHSISSVKFGEGGSSGFKHDKLQESVAKLEGRKEALSNFVDYYNEKRDAILKTVEEINSPAHVQVLYKRHFESKKWEVIAVEMHYTYRHVLRIHDEAIDRLDKILKECR